MLSSKIHQSFAVIVSSFILAACSSGNSNNDSETPSGSSSSGNIPTVMSVDISGSAAKGIIVGGTVTAHPLINGAIDYSTAIGTDTTDSTGAYSINIPNHDGGPVALRVTPATDGTTTMTCDLAAGCGDGVAFGSAIPLTDSSFSLDAVVPSAAAETISVNISVLTDTAASMTAQALAGNTDTSATAIAALIDDANNSVANRFGITGDITEIAIVDITDPVAVATAANDVLEYNLYNAAIVEATLSASDITTVEEAVTSFADDYAAAGGLADKEDEASDTVTLEDILVQTSTVIDALVVNDTNNIADLGELITEVSASTTDIETNGSTDISDGSLDSTAGNTTELVKVKAMVNELRNLGAGVDLTDAEAFQEQVDLAGETFDSDAALVFESMAKGTNAIAYAWEAHFNDKSMTSYTDLESQLNVTIATVGTTVTYNVTGTVTDEEEGPNGEVTTVSVAVNLTAVDQNSSFEDTETETVNNDVTTTQYNGNGMASFEVSGTSISDKVTLTITKGIFKGTASVHSTYILGEADMAAEQQEQYITGLDMSNVQFDLEVTLTETATSNNNPITFTGGIKLDVSAFNLDADEQYNDIYNTEGAWTGWMFERDTTITAGTVDIVISGGFSSLNGDEVNASLAIHIDGKNNAYTCSKSEESIQAASYTSTESCTEETDEKSIGASITLIFGLDVPGISNDISVEFTGSRPALDVETLSLEIQYGSIRFDAEFDSNDQTDTSNTVTITNQDNVILTLTETIGAEENSSEETELSGAITLNGTEYATITDKNDFVQISYIDGSNTSL